MALAFTAFIGAPAAAQAEETQPATSIMTCVSGASVGTQYMPGSYDIANIETWVANTSAKYPNDNNYRVKITDNGDGTKTYQVTLNVYVDVFPKAPQIMNSFTYAAPNGDVYKRVNNDPYQQYLLANDCQGKIKDVLTDINVIDNCSTGADVLNVPANADIYEMSVIVQFEGLAAQTYHVKVWGGYDVGWSGNGKLTPLNGKIVDPAYPASLTVVNGELVLPAGTTHVVVDLYGMKDAWWSTNSYRVIVVDQWVSTLDCPPPPPPTTCTYTIGWYKNHTDQWPTGYSSDDVFYASDGTWLQVFDTPVRGNAYYILAPQFMAATMNSLGTAPAEVTAALDRAAEILGEVAPGDKLDKSLQNEMKALAGVLDSYNNGELGISHC